LKGSKSLHLVPWREIIGTLEQIRREDDRMIIRLSHHSVIELPLHLYADLKPKIGERIGILRTETDYRFRLLSSESEEASDLGDGSGNHHG